MVKSGLMMVKKDIMLYNTKTSSFQAKSCSQNKNRKNKSVITTL